MLEFNRIPTKTIAAHPGEILLKEYLKPMGISQVDLAKALDISIQSVNDIVKARRGISSDTAVLLAAHFETSPEFWINMQAAYDISKHCVEDPTFLAKIKKIKANAKKQQKAARNAA